MESIYNELHGHWEFVKPEPASEGDLILVHRETHLNSIKRQELVYEVAILAVGGAVKASELAMRGDPAFGLIRPPGHHASQNSCWGFCFFNNMAVSIEKLKQTNRISKALIVDIDLHYGDGTANIFSGTPQVTYFHVEGRNREAYLNDLTRCLTITKDCDVVAVSAGFDRHEQDWGGLLKTRDYRTIGRMIKEFAEETCQGRRYGVLEGGYNHAVLGKNVKSFLEGML